MIQIEHQPSRSQLRVFGISWLIFFNFWGAASWWNSGVTWKACVFWFLAFMIPAAGCLRAGILRAVYVGASYITFPIGWILSSAVLMIVYYLVLTPIATALRLAGYDPMKRNFDRTAGTYWLPRKPGVDVERYFKQF